jgi:hypothetical protein
MVGTTQQKLENTGIELVRIAQRYESHSQFLGSNLDDALAGAMEYFCFNPKSDLHPECVFRMCLRREQSRRLKNGGGDADLQARK